MNRILEVGVEEEEKNSKEWGCKYGIEKYGSYREYAKKNTKFI